MKVKLNIRDILVEKFGDTAPVPAVIEIDDLFECTGTENDHEINLDEILENNRMIAHVWTIDDVHETRPDLTDDQAWNVLKACDRDLDSEQGICWETIEAAADKLFDAPIDRVERFGKVIEDYTDHNAKTNLVDLLADGLHWSQTNSVDFGEALQTARTHFAAETKEGGRS